MLEFNFQQLSLNPCIRTCEIQGITYFSVIDVLAEIRETNFKAAQNYYHVLKKRMKKNGIIVPDLKRVRAKTANNKLYFTEFTTQLGISTLIEYLRPNLHREQYRIKLRQDDERVNFHPRVITFFEAQGWRVDHHLKLPLGSQIDVLASLEDETVTGVFIVECKPHLPRRHFYSAVGQILCYWAEYGKAAIPVIATYSSEIDDYIEACCQALGIRLIAVDLLQNTIIHHGKNGGYDLVTEKPLLPKKTKK
jgi:hypothetical protein